MVGLAAGKAIALARDIPLVADATSCLLTAPLDVARFGLLYASAQKNLGVAGLCVLVVREDLLERAAPAVPAALSYRRQATERLELYGIAQAAAPVPLLGLLEHPWVRAGDQRAAWLEPSYPFWRKRPAPARRRPR